MPKFINYKIIPNKLKETLSLLIEKEVVV